MHSEFMEKLPKYSVREGKNREFRHFVIIQEILHTQDSAQVVNSPINDQGPMQGRLVCPRPRVKDAEKNDVGDQKLNSVTPEFSRRGS